MVLYFILFFIGGFVFVSSMFNSGTYGALVFDRKFYCIEKYRTVQKATDIVSIIHNITGMAFGTFVMAYSIMHIVVLKGGEYDINLVHTIFRISLALIAIDFATNIYLRNKHKMDKVKEEIWNQWETQKVVTQDNDHEVNLYRACKRITEFYPVQMAGISLILTVFSFLI